MEKDHEEYNIGVLDIYGFEIFQVRQCSTWILADLTWETFLLFRWGKIQTRKEKQP